jgi:hypothetical protein
MEYVGMLFLFVSGLGFGFYLGIRFAGQEIGNRMRREMDAGRISREELLRLIH